ncbi:TetR/AcrR family transcriptional regulator [Nonomuraea dietziae]|uniref:AcrR family transcriptional regulator n=1 Tax=Nonomuraea dietziae TaxID=65515 RepID=A0A7W5YA55_9ACTN|nr:TetR/AcrR family transcriptional regulator [Nonomuraea dietziae]MBB3726593.1 AcrR family transcriptional regulator [Nonomuraea dietziae]
MGRRAGRRRQDVLEGAARVIAERGAEATRFADVAEASGVPISTLQYYFGNREDLLVAAFRHSAATDLAVVRQGLRGTPWERLLHIAHHVAGEEGGGWRVWVESWRWALRDAEWRGEFLRDYAAWRALLAEVIGEGIADGSFGADGDPDRLASQALALLDGLGMPLALADPALKDPDVLADALRRLLSAR